MMEVPGPLLTAIEHYLAGNASPEEQRLVSDWYHSFNDSEVEIPVPVMELRTKVAARIWERVEQTIQEDETSSIPVTTKRRFPWWRVAVAALLLLVAGFFLFRDYTKPGTPQASGKTPPVVNDVQPGGDRAILTLSDGTRIVLDSAANGMLSQQGNSRVVKTADGQITYAVSNAVAQPEEVLYNTMITPRGGQYKLTLSDGTEVWLNATSAIRYPAVFKGDAREVQVSGEVFFNVTKNKNMPFRVRVMPAALINNSVPGYSKSVVEVFGTQFNILGYDDEIIVKTTLVEGSVKVVNREHIMSSTSRKEQSVMLSPGQQAQVNDAGNMKVINDADVDEATAWINGIFQFKDTDIKTLMRQLSRWYDIDVIYEGQVSPILITGKAPRNISLNTMLKILALSDVKYRIEGKTLTML